jgi:antitoxin (DNA-binding transcriptional repressor) of toxin-antitoxin stability system
MSDSMKTISLRMLLRQPLKVKRMTRAGQPVQVTDNGRPLWILQPAQGTETDEADRRRAIDEILDEVLREKPSKISAAKLLEASRR